MNDYILLRGPKTLDGDFANMEIKIIKKNSNYDLSEYSFLNSTETYDVWVPSKELEKYKKTLNILKLNDE